MTPTTSAPSPTGMARPTDTEAGNLASSLAALAERRGWSDRPAFHQGHRAWTHAEVHDLAARAAVSWPSMASVPATGSCSRCPIPSPG